MKGKDEFKWVRYSDLEAEKIVYTDESVPFEDTVKTWTYTLVKVAEGLGTKDLLMTMCTLKPGEGVAHHSHPDQEEIYILVKGRSQVRTDREKVEAEAYSFFYFPPGCPHSVYNNSTESCDWLFVASKPKE